MATRTVRLDAESERVLAEVQRATGLSTSAVLKQGLVAARDALRAGRASDPWTVYAELDLGPGGYARAPARRAKAAVGELLRSKRRSKRR
jgi:hypothetical protein